MVNEDAAASAVADEASPEASDALVAKVQAGLAALDFDGDETPETEEAEAGETPSDENAADSGESAGADTESGEGEDDEGGQAEDEAAAPEESAAKPADKTSSASTLPEAHRRSLKAYGWDDEAIETNLKANPAQFMETAQRLHSNRVKESQKWAALGRQSRQQVEQGGDDNTADVSVQQRATPSVSSQLKPIDTAALKAKFGDDLPIEEIVGPVNEAIKAVNAVMPQITSSVQVIQDSKKQALQNTVNAFFSGPAVKGYDAVYGKDAETCTEDQYQNRNTVLENADAILVGASRQGRRMGIDEALELAHAGIAHQFTRSAVRTEIAGKVKARNRSISVKPQKGGKGLRPAGGKPKTEAELERRTAQRLREVFANK